MDYSAGLENQLGRKTLTGSNPVPSELKIYYCDATSQSDAVRTTRLNTTRFFLSNIATAVQAIHILNHISERSCGCNAYCDWPRPPDMLVPILRENWLIGAKYGHN